MDRHKEKKIWTCFVLSDIFVIFMLIAFMYNISSILEAAVCLQ